MKLVKYVLMGLLVGQGALASQVVVQKFGGSSYYFEKSESVALSQATESINNQYSEFLMQNSKLEPSKNLKFMCSKVELQYGTPLYQVRDSHSGAMDFLLHNSNYSAPTYYVGLNANVVCTERTLLEKTYLSFAINCEKNPSEQCLSKLQDPEFLKTLNGIENQTVNVPAENNVRAD